MNSKKMSWSEVDLLHDLKHYLPAQAPLKDFVHHNTLHAFQHEPFFEALTRASQMLGYKTSLSLNAFRRYHKNGKIANEEIDKTVAQKFGPEYIAEWRDKMLTQQYDVVLKPHVGKIRGMWKDLYHVDLNALVHIRLFRILNSYLDQGISIWKFPITNRGFLNAIREFEKHSKTSLFNSPRAKKLITKKGITISQLLHILVGEERLYQNYVFDQQFAHPGWSGMVAFVEHNPNALLDKRRISLEEVIIFELLLEIDVMDTQFGEQWRALGHNEKIKPVSIFSSAKQTEYNQVLYMWQLAMENTFYDQVLSTLSRPKLPKITSSGVHSFQAMMCIDDREFSLRTYLEQLDPICETYGTPGHFGLEYYFQPEHGKFHTKVCPAPLSPQILVKEYETTTKRGEDFHFSKHTHGALGALLITHTVGFLSAFKLAFSIFKPSYSASANSSFLFMDPKSRLTIEHKNEPLTKDGLQIGFTVEQMVDVVEGVLKSIGLTDNFAPLVYAVGHGASSVNNTYYAGYDCGACSGRPGSVNARIFANIGNREDVRAELLNRNLYIPKTTQFLGGLHDTTRDEIAFYDEEILSERNKAIHQGNKKTCSQALKLNAKERSRRFVAINTKGSLETIYEKVKKRSVTLYEPRPELNHASNALCIIGTPAFTKKVFFDRRAFTNSYDYKQDPEGTYLLRILNAAAPVCGGINLEYYFSRVDNEKLGAGSKLPHNVIGLNAIANGIEGDLRPGLPTQMTELHDPLRLLMVIEHYPEVVLNTIKTNPATYEWFENEWVNLAVIHPDTHEVYRFTDKNMVPYSPLNLNTEKLPSLENLIDNSAENLPIHVIQ